MRHGRGAVALFWLAVCCVPALSGDASGPRLFNGSGDVAGTARIGSSAVALPLGDFPCRQCHGRDGKGGREGNAPSIVWDDLARSQATRPAYDAQTFVRALKEGMNPHGDPIDALMPRYSLTDETLGSLVSYLERLPEEQRRGIESDRIILGVAIPADNRIAALRFAERLERELGQPDGGAPIFGRRLMVKRLEGDTAAILDAAAGTVAAVMGLVPTKALSVANFERNAIPVLFPLYPLHGDEDRTVVRGLMASRAVILETLAERARADGRRKIVLLRAKTDDLVVDGTTAVDGWNNIPAGTDAVVVAEPQSPAILASLAAQPALYLSASISPQLTRKALEEGLPVTIADSFPDIASPQAASVIDGHALAAAAVVRHVVREAGRDLSRASLVASFDRLVLPELGLDYRRFPLDGSNSLRLLHVRGK